MKLLRQHSMLWFSWLLLLGITFSGCDDKDDPIPPSSVQILSPETNGAFFVGEEVTFVGDAQDAQSYTWEINGEELSTDISFTYSFTAEGEYNIAFNAINESGSISDVVTLQVNSGVQINGMSENEFYLVGDTISLFANIENPALTSFKWVVHDEVLSDSLTFKYVLRDVGLQQITFTAQGTDYASVLTQQVEVAPLLGGALIVNEGNMSNEMGSVSFLQRGGNTLFTNAYASLNPGKTLSNVTQSASYFGDYVYFISQNGPNYIIVADKETLVAVDSITTSDVSLSWPTHLAMVSTTKGYVRDNNGISIIDFSAKSVTNISGVGAAKAQPIVIGNKLFTYSGSNLYVVDITTDQLIHTETFGSSIGGFAEATDGNLWVAQSGTPSTLLKVASSDYTTLKEIEMPEGVNLNAGWTGSSNIMPSHTTENVFVRPSGKKQIYLVDLSTTTPTVSLFSDLSTWSDEETGIIYGEPNVDPVSNDIYIMGIKGYGMDYLINALFIIDGSTGNQKQKLTGVGSFPAMVLFSE
ncbi:DUF5074 domain-containing protein [Limibacter armeniacum]|uniref:DUF5074 domain-containing protein n=1 Tax=Limibacter armeniacum TaxID=466084 RepID=UPI002FE53D8B